MLELGVPASEQRVVGGARVLDLDMVQRLLDPVELGQLRGARTRARSRRAEGAG